MSLPIALDTQFGLHETQIENVKSFPLSSGTKVACADYSKGNQSLTLIEHANGDHEFVEIHSTRKKALIHAKQISASYHGLEGGRIY